MSALTPQQASDLFRQPPERMIDVGSGSAVAYRRAGSGPDVLFVHGWPVSGATFRTLLPHLTEHITCHLIDLPGAGTSRFDPAAKLSIDSHVASIRRVIDDLGIDQLATVGHDSGGLFLRHAIAGDRRVRGVGLIDTEPLRISLRFRSFLLAKRAPGLGRTLGAAARSRRIGRLRTVFGGAFHDRRFMEGEFEEFFLRPLGQSRDHQRAAASLLRNFDTSYIKRLGEVHQAITAPVQLVWGRNDAFFPVAWAEEMLGTFPDAKLTIIDDAGVFSHEEKPAEVAAALLPVLTG